MTFKAGFFYRRTTDGAVFLCEQVKDARILLHIADVHSCAAGERRLVFRNCEGENWEEVDESEHAQFLSTYWRDAFDEYGKEVGEQGIVFRRQYHLDPYLHGVSDTEIRERLAAIADNSIRYDSNGSSRLLESARLAYWHRKAEEALEHLRSIGKNEFFVESDSLSGAQILRLRHDIREKKNYGKYAPWGKVPQLARDTLRPLYKYGEAKYLRLALEQGRFRISPSSCYSDSSLNSARLDKDEGRITLRPSQRGFRILLQDQQGRTITDTSHPRENQLALEIGGDQNFYVWCCSKAYEPRLFVDFEADACLVIHELQTFAERLNSGLYEKFRELPGMYANDVKYYDPLCPDDSFPEMFTSPFALFFYKDFRYAYQDEYRFLWPMKDLIALKPIEIEIGPITDIAELLQISRQ
ncbi:MAG: hypothetical protein WC007_12005 [Pelobacteraceae bacterium]